MASITYLTPDNPYPCQVSKSFKLIGNIPQLISDYKLGKHFDFKIEEVYNLKELHRSLEQHSDGFVRIAGKPREGLDPMFEPIARNKNNFPECESQIILFDVDGWGIDKPESWVLNDPDSTHKLIRDLLVKQGFSFLANTDFIFLLTSSQWTTKKLNCHLYFFLDEPIHIVKLREWCNALANIRQTRVFDPATQRSVQPDYIGKRKCIGFIDPLPTHARLHLCTNFHRNLLLKDLNDQISKDLNSLGWKETGKHSTPIKSNWLSTLELCGLPDRGVNEPAYRSAAQLVQEIGRDQIMANIQSYAEQMHRVAWQNVHKNQTYDSGERDHKKDIQTYNRARFQQYILSACNQRFGDEVDKLKETLTDAIEKAAEGDVAVLFDRPVLEAYSKLKSSHVGVYAQIRNIFKKKLRSQVTLTDFEKACRIGIDVQSNYLTPNDKNTENHYVNKVLDSFDWIEDYYGNSWCGFQNDNGAGGYRILPINANLRNLLYQYGMDISGGTVSDKFGEKVLRLLYGQKDQHSGTDKDRFKLGNVGLRFAPTGGSFSSSVETWINLGMQPSGKSICAKVNSESVEYSLTKDCPVRWRNPENAAPIYVASTGQIVDRFGDIKNLVQWTKERIFDYFILPEEERAVFIGIIMSLLSDRGTSPLIEFVGPHASGKTMAAQLLVDLIDPVKGGLAAQRGVSSLIAVSNADFINVIQDRYLSAFDNASKLSVQWQDTLCQVATGINKDHRIMYVGAYTKVYAKKPIILTALNSLVTRPDLASRTETFHFSGKNFKIKPHLLIDEWEKDKSFLFCGLLYLLRDAIAIFNRDAAETGEDARRMWYNIADYLYYNDFHERIAVQEDRKSGSAIRSMVNSDTCMAIMAWLQDKAENGQDEVNDLLIHLLSDFRSFIRERQGTKIRIKTKIDTIVWKVSSLDIRLPNTPRGFTWELNKHYHVIHRLTGWDVNANTQRVSGGYKREFIRDKIQYGKTLVDDLEDIW